jgi:hypothetical protein
MGFTAPKKGHMNKIGTVCKHVLQKTADLN